jgi:protein involved in polysaccharide export with SLBB domain
MKRPLLLLFVLWLACGQLVAQGIMSDTQVRKYIQSELKAGTPQARIVTSLMQRGVKMDQIRRVRDEYVKKRNEKQLSATPVDVGRMRSNSAVDDQKQEITEGKRGSSDVYQDAVTEHNNMELAVQAESEVTEAQGKKVFGHDIFNQRLLSFEPNMNIATPHDYVLGPGDQIIVDIYGGSQKSLSLTVSPEGSITVPGYGPIQVGGLSVSAAQKRLRSTLGARYSSSELRLTVGQTRTILVNVMGEVRTPGTYHLSAFASVFHALYRAGGISELGTLRNIRVIRGGRTVATIDVYDYILNGRLSGNILLKEDDVIQVQPYENLVGVSGNVKRPMFYELRKNETLSTLIAFAGGFTSDAHRKSVRVVREDGDLYSVYNVDEFEQATFKMADGDAVTVEGMLNRYENMAEVKGAVFRPGQYQIGQQVTTVRSLIERADGLTEDAFTARAVLHRLKADRTLQVIPVDVAGIMAGTVADIPLNNEDVLFIPTQTDLLQRRTLTIEGEVMVPGVYQFADNTTLEDLIMQAGGLTDAASVAKVDVSRRIVDPKATVASTELAKTYSFSLKDGCVIDGMPGFLLEPYDIVQVRRSPGYHTPRSVFVEGEVTFEGSYTLEKKNQRLSDLVKLAGGLTQDAYVEGARLERQINDMERARREMVFYSASQTQNGKDSVSLQKLAESDVYTVGIRLDEALNHPGGDADIVLREGDRLVIPELVNTVKISGDVMYPNTVSFESGKNYKWYVRQAGGFGQRAKKSKTYVIYPNGTMAQVGHGSKITPGCEIIVPSKPKRESLTAAQWISMGTGIASIGTALATLFYVFTK